MKSVCNEYVRRFVERSHGDAMCARSALRMVCTMWWECTMMSLSITICIMNDFNLILWNCTWNAGTSNYIVYRVVPYPESWINTVSGRCSTIDQNDCGILLCILFSAQLNAQTTWVIFMKNGSTKIVRIRVPPVHYFLPYTQTCIVVHMHIWNQLNRSRGLYEYYYYSWN